MSMLITRGAERSKVWAGRLAVVIGLIVGLGMAGQSAAGPAPVLAAKPALIPWPRQLTETAGEFVVRDGTPIVAAKADPGAQAAARQLSDLLRRTRGLNLPVRASAKGPAIRIGLDPTVTGAEAYRLRTSAQGATISASARAGLEYGAITFWQLATADGVGKGPAKVKGVSIDDAPRFAWRGLMLDSARHFQSTAFVEQLIDWMALHKLNVLHWHLVDDQAWRLEIKRYPKLTSVGGWRVEAGAGAAKDIDPATGRPRLYGGVYSQDDVRKIVAYAAARNVTIVPEIELPGHASAAIAAYPGLGSAEPPLAPSSDWGVHANLFNTRDETFEFLQNVFTEVMDLFPSTYIHIGGDEAVKDQWKASAEAQAKIKALGLKDEDALQSWYIHRIEGFLNAHGRRLIGWDEILQGGIAPNASVMSWHGVAGAVTAARSGHDAVVTPSRPLYFNYRQGTSPNEPPGRAPLNTLADVYRFEPAPAELSADERRHILGVQANIWTEHVRTDARIQHMLFPRLSALAEIAWSPESSRDWSGFTARMPAQMKRYRALKIGAAQSAFQVVATTEASGDDGAQIVLANQTGLGEIRFTLDGSAPTPRSTLYTAPVAVRLPAIVTAAAFVDGQPIAPDSITRLDAANLSLRRSAELELCKEAGAIAMEDDAPLNGLRAVFVVNYVDRCWMYKKARLDGRKSIEVTVGSIPFNLQLRDGGTAALRKSSDGRDALEVRLDRCNGPVLARMDLATAKTRDTLTTLNADLPPTDGVHDLCLLFVQSKADPIWTLDSVRLPTP